MRVFKDDPGVRITIEDSTREVNQQLLVSEQRMSDRLNDPSPM